MASRLALLSVFVIVWNGVASAQSTSSAGPTPAEAEQAFRHNEEVTARGRSRRSPTKVDRPVAEYEEAAYFLINDRFDFNSQAAKLGMVRNLPKNVTAVVMAPNEAAAAIAKATFAPYIEPSRLRIATIVGGTGFWVRDSLPVPVYLPGDNVGLVDARYYKNIEPDSLVSQYFKLPLIKHDYFFEGGNFAADRSGNCMMVGANIPDTGFQEYYGCKSVRRFKRIAGIGHIDEHAKFLSDKVVVTDLESYAKELRTAGYEVHLLPRTGAIYETYVNSLLVNGTIFMPAYGGSRDEEAKQVYERLGFKVFSFPSSQLSNGGHGSLHCITMTYPKIEWKELLSALGAR